MAEHNGQEGEWIFVPKSIFGGQQEAPKHEAPKQEAPKQEAPKQEAPKQEAPKQEAPKQETPKATEAPIQPQGAYVVLGNPSGQAETKPPLTEAGIMAMSDDEIVGNLDAIKAFIASG